MPTPRPHPAPPQPAVASVCSINNGGCSRYARCTATATGRTCRCRTGFTGDGVTCTDVNECLSNNGGCNANALCINRVGSRVCRCRTGYRGTGFVCKGAHARRRRAGAQCVRRAPLLALPPRRRPPRLTPGMHAPTPRPLVDIDECATDNGGCNVNAACTNTPGSRTCACKAGFGGDGFTCTGAPTCVAVSFCA